jgi:D-tagatose-1,6-bisphosphate aldolase subunit GatZ/KbaZ
MTRRLLELRRSGRAQLTLLAVCPNSAAVLEAAVMAAARHNAPMLFAATLNQVDRDGGYTGWTPADFARLLQDFRRKYDCRTPLFPCLDHGGPWLKDTHTRDHLSLAEAMAEVKLTLSACLQAGYALLHIDATVDRALPPGQPLSIDLVVERTLELMVFCEAERRRLNLPPVSYEVGTEEVHGGLVDMSSFSRFVGELRLGLEQRGLAEAWPCFIVGKVGTDLHTSFFDPAVASRLTAFVSPYGSLVKGHYTDWVENPAAYPQTGMGGANVGPEFAAAEFQALAELSRREDALLAGRPDLTPSAMLPILEQAMLDSGRWKKWLQPAEQGLSFYELSPERRLWLVETGCRYIWIDERVLNARRLLYLNLAGVMDPVLFVLERIAGRVEHYLSAFNLNESMELLS